MAYITKDQDNYKVVNSVTHEEFFFSTLNRAIIWTAGMGLVAIHII